MTHNNHIAAEIRNENDKFNETWIATNKLVGDTFVPKEELDVSSDMKMDVSPFMVVWLKNIERLCQMFSSRFEYQSFTLIDVGCGSGISTLFFNQNYYFKGFSGFDFSSNLINLANQNINIATSDGFDVSSVVFETGDAKSIQLPNQRLAIFMFNPFGWKTMKEFVSNNIEALRQNKSVVLYANHTCIEELLRFGTLVVRDDFYNLSVILFDV